MSYARNAKALLLSCKINKYSSRVIVNATPCIWLGFEMVCCFLPGYLISVYIDMLDDRCSRKWQQTESKLTLCAFYLNGQLSICQLSRHMRRTIGIAEREAALF